MTLATLVCLTLALAPAQDSADRAADDPAAIVFIADACGDGEGAPPKASLGKLVILTDLDAADPYHEVVALLGKAKQPAAILTYPSGRIGEARAALLGLLPEFVIVVTKPEHLDVNAHFELLEMAASLDADPFADFAFGYVTGATAGEAVAFAKRILAIGSKSAALPKTVVSFGPAGSGGTSFGEWIPHKLAKGFKEKHAYHGPVSDLIAKPELLRGAGILCAGGHGMPEGIDGGLSGEDLRKHQFDLAPALYFSGPCYCGVTGPWFDVSAGAPVPKEVEPSKSFGLAAIASGVTALFAGLDPDRGETSQQELEHLLIYGDALGHASKETFDGAVVALRSPAWKLFRYEEGAGRPQRNLADTMIGGGASRALFGDPTYVPFPPSADPPFTIGRKDVSKALELTWSAKKGPVAWWSCVDVYRCDGGWTHRIAFKEPIPVDTARKLSSFAVAKLTAEDEPLEGRFATAMVERWGGKAYLHVYIVFPPAGSQNVFFVNRDFEAKFVFAK